MSLLRAPHVDHLFLQAIGGLDSARDPTKARVSFDLLSQHVASRPGTLEIVVKSGVNIGKLAYRSTLARRLRLLGAPEWQPSPRSSPRLESTRKTPSIESKEKRASVRKSGDALIDTISSILSPKGMLVEDESRECISFLKKI